MFQMWYFRLKVEHDLITSKVLKPIGQFEL